MTGLEKRLRWTPQSTGFKSDFADGEAMLIRKPLQTP